MEKWFYIGIAAGLITSMVLSDKNDEQESKKDKLTIETLVQPVSSSSDIR